MQDIYLLLGSNLGDREAFLNSAIQYIAESVGVVSKMSSLYQTQAWGSQGQPDFINQVILVKSHLSAQETLKQILSIELVLGRKRIKKWDARIIDIDILFYGNAIINEPDLVVPHPHFHNRRFAIEPMLELNADFIHPKLNKSIKLIALELTDDLSVQNINHT